MGKADAAVLRLERETLSRCTYTKERKQAEIQDCHDLHMIWFLELNLRGTYDLTGSIPLPGHLRGRFYNGTWCAYNLLRIWKAGLCFLASRSNNII